MKRPTSRKLIILVLLAAALAGVFLAPPPATLRSGDWRPLSGRPRVIDVGGGKCKPCKLMVPVVQELRARYGDQFDTLYASIYEDDDAWDHFRLDQIPTQIFQDADGKELWRHTGFLSCDDILAKWGELGHTFTPSSETWDGPREPGLFERLFVGTEKALARTPAIALAAAFVWGVLSILLSPCHLASVPLIVGFIGQQEGMTKRRACLTATLFSAGILATIAAIGAIARLTGGLLGRMGGAGTYLVAGVFLLVGLHLLEVISITWSGPGQVGMKRKGLVAAFTLGLVFGVILSPCTLAFMAPVLTATAAVEESYGAFLHLAYGVGHCALIVVAGTFTGLVQRYLAWGESSGGTGLLKRICGVLVLVAGLWMLYGAR